MARRRSSRKKKSPIGFFSALLLLAAAGGFGYWWTTNKWAPISSPDSHMSQTSKPADRVVIHPRKRVKIYVVNNDKEDPRLVVETRRVPSGVDPRESAIENLIETNQESGDSQFLIPAGTKLLGLHVKDGIAYADFSREIRDNFSGGATNEELLVNSIVHTLTQFKDVEKVQLLVEGKRIESLGGHLDVSSPISGDSALLGEGDSE